MADRMVLKGELRDKVGSRHAARLRKGGKLPAIIYGHGKDPAAVSFDLHDFTEGLHHGHRLFDADIDKSKETLLIKDLQYDHLGKGIIHVDMVRVDLAEVVTVMVPLELKGTSEGSHEGGIIDEHLDHLEVECKVSDIPEVIEVSIKEVGVGDAIHAGDIELPSGMKLATAADALVLTCHLVAAAKSTEEMEEEMPSAPEVITEKAPEEGTEEQSG
ncbi:MAG: 50S ribosomal protein L25 [Planctomycetes bacterium]|nr:50S ribosomal protein L25 [Planctomycetota bacterium]